MGEPLRERSEPSLGERVRALRIERPQEPDHRPSRTRWWWGAGLLVAALALASWLAVPRLVGDPATPVEVAPAVATGAGAGAVSLEASGYVTARRRATVSSQVTGRLDAVLAEEGEAVERGQVVARLDSAEAEAQAALMEAQLAAARQALAEVRVRLEKAEVDLRRHQELAAEGIVSPSMVDSFRTEVESLRARLAHGAATVEVAERSLAVSLERLDNLVVRAPFSGIVVTQAAQPGETVSPVTAGGGFTRTGIFTLIDPDSLEIEVDVSESNIDRITPDQPAVARLDAYPSWKIPARVITTVPTADRTRATVKVRLALDERDRRILPEMGVRVTFLEGGNPSLADAPPTVLVARSALLREDGGDSLFVVGDDGTAQRRAVTVERISGDRAWLSSGVAAGERVIVAAPAELTEGQRVRIASGEGADE